MMLSSFVIAIDGYVATGKWTTAKALAQRLWCIYLDTGAMYRAVTYYAIENNLLESDEHTKQQMMENIHLSFEYNPTTQNNDIILNGVNIEHEIRQTHLSLQMKPIVTSPAVRASLREKQRNVHHQWLVADGRDMGTVVFPDADLKIFLTCDAEIRAQRRYQQLLSQWSQANLDDIHRDSITRDTIDYLAPDAVNTIAPDAIAIDTASLSVTQVVDEIVRLFDAKRK